MVGMLAFSIGVNILLGRYIHWNIVAGLGAGGFLLLTVARRYWF